MANNLPIEKQIAAISALAEGSGVRQTERMTGVNREAITKLGVRVGTGCASLLDHKMRDPPAANSNSMKFGDSSVRKNAMFARMMISLSVTFGGFALLILKQN